MEKPRYVILDCETTGLDPAGGDKVIEIALISYSEGTDGEVLFHTFLNPERHLGEFHAGLVLPEQIENAPTFHQVAADLLQMLQDKIIVAHNARFDLAFLRHEFSQLQIALPPLFHFCTIRLAKLVTPRPRSFRLGDCCQHFGIPHNDPHTALGDARAAEKLFSKLKNSLPYHGFRAQLALDEYPGLVVVGEQIV